jgi:hypothetical protein
MQELKPFLLILKWMIKVIVAFVTIFYIKEEPIVGIMGLIALTIFYFEIREEAKEIKNGKY